MSGEPSSPMISLKTGDNVVFQVEPSIVKEMEIVQSFIEEAGEVISMPLPNVSSYGLTKIIDYLKQHRDATENNEFDAEFLRSMKLNELKQVLTSAHYLNVKGGLLHCVSKEIADRIQNKSVEFVRKFFGLENDFTPEEEARLREERAWAFDGVDEDDYEEL